MKDKVGDDLSTRNSAWTFKGSLAKNFQSHISYVPQDNFLLNDSIINNICLGEDENIINNERFQNSLKLSCLSDFTSTLEDKENTL